MSDLRDLSYRQVSKAIDKLAKMTKKQARSNAFVRHDNIGPSKITISWEMLGMGHNEPRSYGIHSTEEFTQAQVYEALGIEN